MKQFAFFLWIAVFAASCQKDHTPDNETPLETLAGGATTIFSSGPDAFTFPLANLDPEGIKQHFLADGVFGQQFVSAPAAKFGGIGPLFNQNSCESCHVRNGRGTVPQFDGDPATGLLLRLSVPGIGAHGGVIPAPGFGDQLQHKAIFGATAEGKLSRTELIQLVEYLDGNSVSLTQPTYTVQNPYLPLPANLLVSPRNAPPVHGLGLLEAIPDAALLALEDAGDANGDGISGRANMVWDVLQQKTSIGRFGWKAEQPTGAQQAAAAAHSDMGLTNYYFPLEHCDGQENCMSGLQTELDVDAETTDLFHYYFQTLAVPAPRDLKQPTVARGKVLFTSLNCSGCHVPGLKTGDYALPALANQTIFPYTDLLLHDMGEGLSDNRPSFLATGREWRTPPLWGIGLTQVVNPKAGFLHDGRARTLEEAILWHGGEAEASKTAFMALSKTEREAVVAFLLAL
jgi:CxxC motif-containing protein (DUF1111 family)